MNLAGEGFSFVFVVVFILFCLNLMSIFILNNVLYFSCVYLQCAKLMIGEFSKSATIHKLSSFRTIVSVHVGFQTMQALNDVSHFRRFFQTLHLYCLFVCVILIRICPTGSTPEGGPTESSPTTQATLHPWASLLVMSPIPPYLCHAPCIRSVPSPVLLSCTDILPSIWSAPSLSSCPTHIFNPHKYEPLKPHI